MISICIWPLLSSAQIHKEHSNTKSLYVWPGEGCAKRGTWHPGLYCPKLKLVQHSPWGLAAIPSTISCLEQRVPGTVQFARIHHFLTMTFKPSADFFPEFESRNNQHLIFLGYSYLKPWFSGPKDNFSSAEKCPIWLKFRMSWIIQTGHSSHTPRASPYKLCYPWTDQEEQELQWTHCQHHRGSVAMAPILGRKHRESKL